MSVALPYRWAILLGILTLPLGCKQQLAPTKAVWEEPITQMKFVRISKGEFVMGDSAPNSRSTDTQAHKVVLDSDYWLGITEVTQQQWQTIMGRQEPHPEKPSPFRNKHPNYPVVSVSYHDIQKFITELNQRSSGSRFRLPTEAEWEYACRAKTTGAYHFGDTLTDAQANYNPGIGAIKLGTGHYIGHPTDVGRYAANAWELYDMHGNVWEWVSDWYAPYSNRSSTNPTGPVTGELKVIRGGSWYFGAESAQSHFRKTHRPELWGFSIGFRLVREAK